MHAAAEIDGAARYPTDFEDGLHMLLTHAQGLRTCARLLALEAQVRAHDGDAEGVADSIRALQAATGATPGLKAIVAEARDLVRRPVLADELKKVDVALIDPPRAGAAEQTAQLARSKVARVIAVSCNPTTFVRDARLLVDAGFRLERVLPVDQFLWSPHMELAAVLSR